MNLTLRQVGSVSCEDAIERLEEELAPEKLKISTSSTAPPVLNDEE